MGGKAHHNMLGLIHCPEKTRVNSIKKIIYRICCILLGTLKHLGCEIDGIVDFLKTSYPENESVLVGCRASPGTPYECCEYDVIVLNVNGENSSSKSSKSSKSSSSSNSNSTAQNIKKTTIFIR